MGLEVGVQTQMQCVGEKDGDAASKSSTLWDATGPVSM